MKLEKLAGVTSEIWQVFIRDSSSTTGAGLTGLAFNSGSLTAYYHRDTDTTATVINLVTMTVGTFTSSGFKEIDATNMPGWYQFCPPNAALASGAKSCAFHLKGATNMAPLPIEVQLVSYNPDNATTLGLTNLDAAVSSRMATYTQPTGFLAATFPSGTVANTTNITAGTITTVTNLTNAPTSGDLTATMKASVATATWTDTTAGDFTVSASIGKSVMNGVALGTGLTVNDITTKTGYSLSSTQTFNNTGTWTGNLTGSVGSVTGAVGSVTGAVGSVTGNVGGNVTGSVGSVVGAVGSVTGNVGGNVTGSVGSVASGGITSASLASSANNAIADGLLNRDMSVGTDSGSPTFRTPRQAFRFLRNKWAISGGTLTVYAEDDATASWTATPTTDNTAQPIISNDPAGP